MTYKYYLFILCLCCVSNLLAQRSTTVSGATVSNSNGTLSYSIGESFTTFKTNDTYSVNSGVVQTYFIAETLSTPESDAVMLTWKAYPNPTTDVLVLSAPIEKASNYTYELYSIDGKAITKGRLESDQTNVSMQAFKSGTYILNLSANNQLIKSFKILKN